MPSNQRTGRTTRIPVRLRPDENVKVRERAHACGMTLARYMRETALGAVPKARPRLLEMAAVRDSRESGTT